MKILLLAPQPFFQERGTPIAVDLLAKYLERADHDVDLLTYNEGDVRHYERVNHHRIRSWFGIRDVRPGLSGKKIVLDVFFFLRFLMMMTRRRYDVVHAVEESVFMAAVICPIFGVKYVYDMDSLMTTQVIDKLPVIKFLRPFLLFFESIPMRFASAVVPVCQALADVVKDYRIKGLFTLKDVSLIDSSAPPLPDVVNVRSKVANELPVLMYIGNLESYQGIDLMIDAFSESLKETPANLVIIGGEDQHISLYQKKVAELSIESAVFFLGKQPVSHLFDLMRQADLLMSPRIHGVNTPMKIYSYLDSGVAVVATDLPTHSQVMDRDTACLTEPNSHAIAVAITKLLNDPKECQRLAVNAKNLIEREHSKEAFNRQLTKIYDYLAEL